ncbi:ricin-like [Malania oleifera]|uniref:ricin-like n=1 Tax=Malania oleifera TaxID=397392 RepID=UPI0025ADCCC8|nr:ricin-like [Malania oleifera]
MGVFGTALVLMKRSMKLWGIILAAWLWWTAVNGPWPRLAPWLPSDDHNHHHINTIDALHHMTVRSDVSHYPPRDNPKFDASDATPMSYRLFIGDLHNRLANTNDTRHGILVLRDPSSFTTPSERFILVDLCNGACECITLAIDVTDLYAVGYRAGNNSFFFNETRPVHVLFADTSQRIILPFTGSYPSLQRAANASREDIPLGACQLQHAISRLSRTSDNKEVAHLLLVCIHMVVEATRFRYIERVLAKTYENWGRVSAPDDLHPIVSYENNWGSISRAIQEADREGAFGHSPIRLDVSSNSFVNLTHVRDYPDLLYEVGIMLFFCAARGASHHASSHDRVRSVGVDVYAPAGTCTRPEPTVRIIGWNGLCADVQREYFHNEQPVILWPCKPDVEKANNHLWSLRSDGTIRTKNGEFCLTFLPISRLMIYDCQTTHRDEILWELWEDGTIMNPKNKLVLSAELEKDGTLSVLIRTRENVKASGQCWLAGNNLEPYVTSIVGMKDMCLETDNYTVTRLAECRSGRAEQKWAVYADGSIWPQQNRENCLDFDDQSDDKLVKILSCNPASSSQRWVFASNGTILNIDHRGRRLAMDVRRSNPDLHQIIMYQVHENPNQQWYLQP